MEWGLLSTTPFHPPLENIIILYIVFDGKARGKKLVELNDDDVGHRMVIGTQIMFDSIVLVGSA